MEQSCKRILFVDDEPNILSMLGRMIAQSGQNWQGDYCDSVDKALEALRAENFDTVVSDIRMPSRDGFELIREMRADPRLREIPIIILTGEAERTLKHRVLDMGATDLLNKPVARDDLFARLRSALRLKDYQDQLNHQVLVLDGLVKERTEELERSHHEVVWRLAKAGEFRDDQTGDHVARVAYCSCLLAEGIGMDSDAVDVLFQASALHDIGKIGIPDSILLKPGRLTPEERTIIERHALIGYDILTTPPRIKKRLIATHFGLHVPTDGPAIPSHVLAVASAVARHHHERWDGSGYPDQLAGTAIPWEARAVSIADVYDALVSERPYKTAMSHGEATALIAEQAGRQFDPAFVEVFLGSSEQIMRIYREFDSAKNLPQGKSAPE